ncbi:MAG: adenylate/guanylate cyclase domain-containing protein [Pseudomonadota bacterium]
MAENIPGEATSRYRRLYAAQARGLRLAILCRTLAVLACAIWFFLSYKSIGQLPRGWGIFGLSIFVVIGAAYYPLIGSRWDRPWVKYIIYTLDVAVLCALFVLIPVSAADDVPQIIAFRAYGIYYLLPFLGLACLSMSWGLVAWTGTVIAAGWWSAFSYVISGMERTLSWGDLPLGPTAADYERVFLSPDFVSIGGRVEETGFVLITAFVLSLAVYRARQVFFAQIQAEDAREKVSRTLGQYVPETVARRLLHSEGALEPQVRIGSVLIVDIEQFSDFANGRQPHQVITTLNEFLAACADEVSKCDGVVVSYLGDGLLATFNTPIEVSNPAESALSAARALLAMSEARQFNGTGFRLRAGIATGEIAAGIVGSSSRQAFTVYGETVNRAARLEQLNKQTGSRILMDKETRDHLEAGHETRPAGEHQVQGLAQPLAVWAAGS